MPMRERHSRPPCPGSVPRTVTSPLSRCRYPSRISTVVVLPAPLGPSSAKTSPCQMSRSTPSTAVTSPYVLRRPLTCTLTPDEVAGSGLAAVFMTLSLGPPIRGHNGQPAIPGVHHSVDQLGGTRQQIRLFQRRHRAVYCERGSRTRRIASGRALTTSLAPIGASPVRPSPAPPAA